MTRGRTTAAVLLAVATGSVASTGGPAARAGVAPTRVRATEPAGAVVTILVRDNVFVPADITITPGTTLRWVNQGRNDHDVVGTRGTPVRSPRLRPGRSFAHRFERPGTFAYYCSLHGAPGKGQHGSIVVSDHVGPPEAAPVGGRESTPPEFVASGRTIRVPQDAPTIQRAVDQARTGDLVLVAPGVYRESVTVATDGVVVRGVDRNRTILDGRFRHENGISVVGADGVAIENLTARNYTYNGFFWTGVRGYRGSYLTAYRNGDYGIYAFDSQWGTFERSYASGSPDAGFYIGQCDPCQAVVTDVVAEYNQIGYSGTNASGDLYVVRSTFRANRTGVVPNSLDTEALAPQGRATIAGNLVERNGDPKAAKAANDTWDLVYGAGIVVVGGVDNEIVGNDVRGNSVLGIAVAPNPGLGTQAYPATGNRVIGNSVHGSGLADLAVVLVTVTDGNCFAANEYGSTAPAGLEALMPCDGVGTGDPDAGALALERFLDVSRHPEGRVYRATPVPARQPSMPRARTAPARPAGAPPPVDLDATTATK